MNVISAETVTDVASAQAMGKGGSALFDSATPFAVSSGHPMASGFMPLTDTIFSALTGAPNSFREGTTNRANLHNYSGTAIGSITWAANVYYPGHFTGATVSSGLVIFYF